MVCVGNLAVEPGVLAAVVNRLEEWSFPDYHSHSPEVMELLFSAMAINKLSFKKLTWDILFGGSNSISTISPAVFGAC